MLVILLNEPCGPTDFVTSSNQGMTSASGASELAFTVRAILLPWLDSQCGHAYGLPIFFPFVSNTSHLVHTYVHPYAFPYSFYADHSSRYHFHIIAAALSRHHQRHECRA